MKLVRNVFFFFVILFFFSSLTKNIFEYRNNMGFYDSYKREYEKTKRKNQELKTQILKNKDQHEIEKTIRDDLNLLKPNEVAIIIPSPSPTPIVITPTIAPTYKQWANTFLKN